MQHRDALWNLTLIYEVNLEQYIIKKKTWVQKSRESKKPKYLGNKEIYTFEGHKQKMKVKSQKVERKVVDNSLEARDTEMKGHTFYHKAMNFD